MVVALLLFYAGPILFGVWASLQGEGQAMTGGRYVGMAHYESLLRDARFRNATTVTVVFTVTSVSSARWCGRRSRRTAGACR